MEMTGRLDMTGLGPVRRNYKYHGAELTDIVAA